MYTLGNSVPLILQGAAQREVLNPDQTLRVNTLIAERGGIPSSTYTTPPTSGFLSAIAGDIPLWMLAAGGVVLATLITRR